MANIIGTNGNDTLKGSDGTDITKDDTLTGNGGKDQFIYNYDTGIDTITDFGGVGKGVNPSAGIIAEVDSIKFQQGAGFTAQNMLLTQNGNNLEITFEGIDDAKVILQNFALENLNNLSKSTGATVDLGNILFDGLPSITDNFDVFNANSTQSTIFKKNTVTFLNDLSNNVNGFDNSDDVINGQEGDDIIGGLSGNDILRGGAGNDTLTGGTGDDTLNADYSSGDNLLDGDDGNDFLFASGYQYYSSYNEQGGDLRTLGNSTLNGGAGNDNLSASGSTGDNLLSGGDGNDSVSVFGYYSSPGGDYFRYKDTRTLGNNTLNGGAGNDTLSASGSKGNNLLSGSDGNDSLIVSGFPKYIYDSYYETVSLGNNTLDGGAGNDTLDASGSTGNNLLSGGDGNDSIYVSAPSSYRSGVSYLVTQTVDGGKGDDFLSVDYTNAGEGIRTTFNAITNIGSITAGTNLVNYKSIEGLNISGTSYDDNIVGNSGNDTLSTGYGGKDTIDGEKGDDVLSVNYRNVTGGIASTFDATSHIGSITAGKNQVSYNNIERLNISGTSYDDNIVGSSGNDTLSVGYDYGSNRGNDTINGDTGDDLFLYYNYYGTAKGITSTFDATSHIGSITAGTNQVSYNNIERLYILGTAYDDNIVGSNGNDTLSGGYGYGDYTSYTGSSDNDTLYGGDGTDTFVFNSWNDYEGVDYLYDFNATNELIQVSAAGFDSRLSIGSLQATQFTIGTSATTNTQRFIYNSVTGGLYFDLDGSASGFTQVQFAQLSVGLSVSEKNFVVV
ncbi:MAG: calcium-binding protein [Nostoc sp.]|uniref:beta strand repeat-containing protein n=1 Tax=Nostoc sp. TaxID=1180 RepID=UPI002FF81CAF